MPPDLTMKTSVLAAAALSLAGNVFAAPQLTARDEGQFDEGQPISGDGKGAEILGEFFQRLDDVVMLTKSS